MLHLDSTSGQVFCGEIHKTLASDTFIVDNETFTHVKVNFVVDGYRHDILIPVCKLSSKSVITLDITLEVGGSDEEQ